MEIVLRSTAEGSGETILEFLRQNCQAWAAIVNEGEAVPSTCRCELRVTAMTSRYLKLELIADPEHGDCWVVFLTTLLGKCWADDDYTPGHTPLIENISTYDPDPARLSEFSAGMKALLFPVGYRPGEECSARKEIIDRLDHDLGLRTSAVIMFMVLEDTMYLTACIPATRYSIDDKIALVVSIKKIIGVEWTPDLHGWEGSADVVRCNWTETSLYRP